MFDFLKYTLKRVQSTNDFNVRVSDPDWKQEWIDLISNQTTGVRLNFAWKRVELDVRQLRSGYIQGLIFHILDGPPEHRNIGEIRVCPAKRQAYEYVFTNGRLVDHEAAFSYYSVKPLEHHLVFDFESVQLISKEDDPIGVLNQTPEHVWSKFQRVYRVETPGESNGKPPVTGSCVYCSNKPELQ